MLQVPPGCQAVGLSSNAVELLCEACDLGVRAGEQMPKVYPLGLFVMH